MRGNILGTLAGLVLVLLAHSLLVARVAWVAAPHANEAAHFAAGLYHWQTGRLDLYRVNPPLVRLLCTWPWRNDRQWQAAGAVSGAEPLAGMAFDRCEWRLGESLVDVWGTRVFRHRLFLARLGNLLWSLVGGLYCWRWARSVWGSQAGWAAVTLWSFCPNIVAWTATLGADVAGASLALAACWHFRRAVLETQDDESLETGSMSRSAALRQVLLAGVWTGLALLAKMTCLALPVIFAAWVLAAVGGSTRRWTELRQGGVAWGIASLVAVGILHGGYAFDRDVGGSGSVGWATDGWERLLGQLLPANYARGLLQQRADFARGRRSFCWGRWSDRGWWYYYGAAALVKLPLGTLGLIVGSVATLFRAASRRVDREGLTLLLPVAVFALLVSSQTGFSQHFRYVAPCLPFLHIVASRMVEGPTSIASRLGGPLRFVAWLALFWSVVSSLAVGPRCHAYFHELAGGQSDGYRYLADSSLEWGEDVELAVAWFRDRGIGGPVYCGLVHDRYLRRLEPGWRDWPEQLEPGWYLASLQRVSDPLDACHRLGNRKPVARVGAALGVYYVGPSIELPATVLHRREYLDRAGRDICHGPS